MSRSIESGYAGTSITNANVTNSKSRGIYIGTSANYDFCFDGTNWINFQGCIAGTVLPFQAVGARITSGSVAPNAGDIVFLY